MSDRSLLPMVTSTYVGLADTLDRKQPEGWDTASLCAGWRVREVVAHVTMPVRYPEDVFMAELREDNFDFTRLSNRLAARDAELSTNVLVANLRDGVLHGWTPPGGGDHGALNHAVIHSLDITVPLGEPPCASEAAIRVVLDDLTRGGGHAHFEADIAGRRLRATDLDWSYGSGPELAGAAADLALHLCGRDVPADRLGSPSP